MHDQAEHLRSLVRDREPADAPDAERPRLIVVCGGKGGVGTTTIALNVATSLAAMGLRTVLVDADSRGGDIVQLCRLDATQDVLSILTGEATLHEVLIRGPVGLQIVAGSRELTPEAWTASGIQRLLGSLPQLSEHVDLILVDAGAGLSDTVRRFWHAADEILLITQAEAVSITDAYAAIKVISPPGNCPPVRLVVNAVNDPLLAEDVYQRILRACQRFLGRSIESAGHVPETHQAMGCVRGGIPLVMSDAENPTAVAFEQLAAELANRWLEHAGERTATANVAAA